MRVDAILALSSLPKIAVSTARRPSRNVTELLRAWSKGDQSALEALTPLVYGELHRLARRYMSRESDGHTLQATALINEVYLRLVDLRGGEWQDRAHFFAVCARLMRRILIDFARSRESVKRGGRFLQVTLGEESSSLEIRSTQLLVLERALTRLSGIDPRKGNVVELRFFGGLTVKETAEALQVSADTVMRDWSMARAWLLREMEGNYHDSA
jgi:RNA polymerase sigma-70 factor, ECF subfamily